GVFSVVRHPIYLSAILFYVALLVASLSILAFVIWIVTVLFYITISRHEEKLLTERFGKDYENYMKEVPMLFPRIRS
ncbi:MAG: isoprenylcysteine carboxylmethyltransferase family protein, partial [Bacteroidetes bacterium]|nr:isoprenylcysteine carboxylmethyltransferase family protein [Bacteroidota bacterium]